MIRIKHVVLSVLLIFSIGISTSYADDDVHKVVIQVSTADPLVQKIALNNAVNMQKEFGAGNVEIEIVAYGPGLSIMMPKNKLATRVKSLAVDDDISFLACKNTMNKIKKKKGKLPKLTEGVTVVPSGVVRVIELQEKNYAYIRP